MKSCITIAPLYFVAMASLMGGMGGMGGGGEMNPLAALGMGGGMGGGMGALGGMGGLGALMGGGGKCITSSDFFRLYYVIRLFKLQVYFVIRLFLDCVRISEIIHASWKSSCLLNIVRKKCKSVCVSLLKKKCKSESRKKKN